MKISRLLVLGALLLCMGTVNTSAQAFTKYNVSNPKGNTTFYSVSNSKNTKIYDGKNWKYKVTSISFSKNVSGTYGMAFAPMRKSKEGIYMLCGGKKGWAKKAMANYESKGWNRKCGSVGDYYLGVRLDTVLTKCSASAAGDWNAN